MTRAEISKRYSDSDKGRAKKKEWVEANKEHLVEYHAQWIKDHQDRASAALAKWRRENRAKYNAQYKRYRDRNKEKFSAYRKFKRALKAGILVRPIACEKCGEDKKRIDAHHHLGYDKPLDVQWLCRQCHVDIHKISTP